MADEGRPAVRKKIDYGRASEQPRPLSGMQYLPPTPESESPFSKMVRRGSSMERNIIATVAGCAFLLGAFVAMFFCLKSLWEGVFGALDPYKAVSGFAGATLITYLCGWAGWRFLYRSS